MSVSGKIFGIITFLFMNTFTVFAQSQLSTITPIDSMQYDTSKTVKIERKHSPKVASYLSAALPGAGQIFNKKYWKFFVIYAGFGAGYHFYNSYNKSYVTYRDIYNNYKTTYTKKGLTPPTDTTLEYKGNFWTPNVIQDARNKARKSRDFTLICISAWYLLNIVDACVDAYLFEYDMSDNLSIHLKPQMYYLNNNRFYTGMAINIHHKKHKNVTY